MEKVLNIQDIQRKICYSNQVLNERALPPAVRTIGSRDLKKDF